MSVAARAIACVLGVTLAVAFIGCEVEVPLDGHSGPTGPDASFPDAHVVLSGDAPPPDASQLDASLPSPDAPSALDSGTDGGSGAM